MSRFSPTVLPTSGASFARALGQGVNTFLATRQQKRQQDIEDEQRQRSESIQNAQLGEQGIHLMQPGELPPTFDINVTGGPNPDDIVTRAITPLVAQTPRRPGAQPMDEGPVPGMSGPPLAAALSRNLSFGPGYYVDRDEQAATAQRSADAKFSAMLAEALAKGKAEDILDPTARSDRHAVAQSTILKNSTPPVRNIDPLSPEGIAASIAKARGTLGLQTSVHAANRDYDVAHPMPTQDNGKMTEFSNKAALVYPRAAQAAATLEPFFRSGVPATSVLGKVTFGQYGVPEDIQRANQAAETISSAILRLESGAAISEHEVKEYAKQFLPQPGDSPAVLQQKRATLQTQLERMRQAANPTMRRDTAAPAGGGDTAGTTLPLHVQTIDEMIRAGKSDAEIKAAMARGVH